MSKITTSLLFDMRAPAFGAPRGELYAAALNMAQFADEIGVATINLMEHHGSEDGYLPQPFVLGGGIAARTRNCRLVLGAVVLPLHDPVKVAEQIAVLDIMSQGRLNVTIGAGYVPSEFAAFGATLRDRGRLVDEGIAIIPVMTKGGAIGIVGYGAGLPGGFGEFMLLDEDFLLEVPADLDPDLAALIEPLAVGMEHARVGEPNPGDICLVLGCGAIGLGIIAGLRMKGVEMIVAADFDPHRRALARAMGAVVAIDPRERSPYLPLPELNDRAVEVVYECVGKP